MNPKYILVAAGMCLLACATSYVSQPLTPRQIQCPDMGTCLAAAGEYCPTRKFTMLVQDGSQSGPTVAAWRPSPDGQFHLLITCK